MTAYNQSTKTGLLNSASPLRDRNAVDTRRGNVVLKVASTITTPRPVDRHGAASGDQVTCDRLCSLEFAVALWSLPE